MSAPEGTRRTPAQRRAANEIVDAIVEALRSDRGVHAQTAIAAAARMGGTFLFRSFGFETRNTEAGSPESPLRRIAARHGLSTEQAAHACALAAARLVKMCAEVLDAQIGFALAAQGFVEGSKTMPVSLAADAQRL